MYSHCPCRYYLALMVMIMMIMIAAYYVPGSLVKDIYMPYVPKTS